MKRGGAAMLLVQWIGLLASLSVIVIAWRGVRQQRLSLGETLLWLTGGVLGLAFSLFPGMFTTLARMLGFARLSDLILTSLVILITILMILHERRMAMLEARLADLARSIAKEEHERHGEERKEAQPHAEEKNEKRKTKGER